MKHKLNWKRDPHLARFPKSEFLLESLPASVDLRPVMPPVVDQLDIGSCTGNAWAYLLGCLAIKGLQMKIVDVEQFNGQFVPLSRLFIYYNERMLQGTVNEDSGATLTNGMQAVSMWGICPESVWTYSDANEYVRPVASAYVQAMHHRVPHGTTIDNSNINNLKACLAAGYPVVGGIAVYQSFMNTGSDGMVPMPDVDNEQLEGGHALCFCGYDDEKQVFTLINSWNTSWGDNGFGYIPYSYLSNTDLASDFWTLRI